MGPLDAALKAGRDATKHAVTGLQDRVKDLQLPGQNLGDQLNGASPVPPSAEQPTATVALTAIERARHLVDKCTFGPTPGLVEEVAAQGPEAWLARQLEPSSISDFELELLLVTFPSLRLDPAVRRIYEFAPQEVAEDVQLAALTRAVRSGRQLQEMMVQLWQDHFNTFVHDGLVAIVKASADADIRSLALGRFDQLLLAVIKSPAMLIYLDNNLSRVPDPNENLGRELCELHSLGVESGFTEDDVLDAARAITGWTVNDGSLRFRFEPAWHYEGPLSVMGWSHPGASGPTAVEQGEELIRYLAHHPATANRIATKIARRFVSDDPSPELIAHLAAAYSANNTSITSVLEALFVHPEFWDSGGAKAKRPFEMVAGALRSLVPNFAPWGGHFSVQADSTRRLLRAMGHAPFEWLAPDGYPEHGVYWTGAGTWLQRWNGLLALANNRVDGVAVDAIGIRNQLGGTTVAEFVEALGPRLIGRPLDNTDIDILVSVTGAAASDPAENMREVNLRHLLAVVMALPVAQVR